MKREPNEKERKGRKGRKGREMEFRGTVCVIGLRADRRPY